LTFFGNEEGWESDFAASAVLLGVRQLDDESTFVGNADDDETLVANVDTLLMLELLYLVNAEVDVPALDVVDIELRQLLEELE